MTRLVIIGDSHLQATNPRNEDRLRAFDQIIGEGLALRELGAWLHVGDVFHARSTPDDRNAVAARLVRMADAAPVLVLYGNHESATDLHVFGKLKARYPILVVDRPQTVLLRVPTSDVPVCVFCLPYPTKAGLAAAGVAPGDVQGTATAALDPIFMMAAADLEEARRQGAPALMIGHATIAGSVSSVGQPMGLHGEIVVTPTHLNRLGTVPKIFGHIHKPQEIFDAVYAGSICRMDFGETEAKRYLVVTFATPTTWCLDSFPIDCPPRYHVEGLLTRDAFTWQVTKGPGGDVDTAPASWRGAEVRVRYRFAQSEKSALSAARVYAEFAEAARLEVEPIAVPDRALRAPEVAAARTLAEKLAAYQQVQELVPSVAEKLAALEHADPLAVLSPGCPRGRRERAGGGMSASHTPVVAGTRTTLEGDLSVFIARDTFQFEVWIGPAEDIANFNIINACIAGIGSTRDEAIADALRSIEAVAEYLQSPPGVIPEQDVRAEGRHAD
jgi:DNA repair exonuclease SbcCD nuclease subunit